MPPPATQQDFKRLVKSSKDPAQLVEAWLREPSVPACANDASYQQFRDQVRAKFPQLSQVYIAGSANWGYSLNPEKNFRPFGPDSDIDVAAVSEQDFNTTWEALRDYHRRKYYLLDKDGRFRLRRNGENVYAGFVSPEWIPEHGHSLRYRFQVNLSDLRTPLVGRKPVRMLFFKSFTEVVDYYRRGVINAQGRIPDAI